MAGSAVRDVNKETLFKLFANFDYAEGHFIIKIYEYEIANVTEKNYMARRIYEGEKLVGDKTAFPKEDLEKVKFDVFNHHWFNHATLYVMETTLEEVEEHYVPMLRDKVKEYFEKRRDAYQAKVDMVDKFTLPKRV